MTDVGARKALAQMAQEEMGHFKYLQHQYKAVLENGNYDFAKAFIKKGEDENENPIFSDAIKERIKDSITSQCFDHRHETGAGSHDLLSLLREKADSKEAKQFYTELADWEQQHYKAFESALNSLKEEYWTANDYMPM